MRKAFDDLGVTADLVELSKVKESVQAQAGRLEFSEGEMSAAFEQMSSDNAIMIVDDKITPI